MKTNDMFVSIDVSTSIELVLEDRRRSRSIDFSVALVGIHRQKQSEISMSFRPFGLSTAFFSRPNLRSVREDNSIDRIKIDLSQRKC